MFQVGDVVWHAKFKRGEVAYSVGTDIRVMFENSEWNPRISTEPAEYIDKDTRKDNFKTNLDTARKELDKEIEEELKNTTLTQQEQEEYRRERQQQRAKEVVWEEETTREATKKSAMEGHVIYWDSEGYQPPTTIGGKTDSRYESYPAVKGYFKVHKLVQPMSFRYDRETGERKFHPIEDMVDLYLIDNKTNTRYLVRIDARYNPELSVARKVPFEELSLLMDEGDSFGSFA